MFFSFQGLQQLCTQQHGHIGTLMNQVSFQLRAVPGKKVGRGL